VVTSPSKAREDTAVDVRIGEEREAEVDAKGRPRSTDVGVAVKEEREEVVERGGRVQVSVVKFESVRGHGRPHTVTLVVPVAGKAVEEKPVPVRVRTPPPPNPPIATTPPLLLLGEGSSDKGTVTLGSPALAEAVVGPMA